MAKRLFLLVAGALALTACTNEEVIDDVAASRNVIKFENAVNKLSRAKDLTNTTLEQFNVYGFYTMPNNPNHANEVFTNEAVTKDGGLWKYTNIRYWLPDATYYFYAYSCGSVSELNTTFGEFKLDTSNDANDGKGKPATERTLEIDNYISDHSHQHDLIFASSTVIAETTTNSPVSFTFQHILSKLQAKFSSKFSDEYTVVISNVQVDNIRNQGDYDFTFKSTDNGWKNQVRKAGQPYVYLLNTKGEGLAEGEIKDNAISVTSKDAGPAISNTAYVLPYKYEVEDVTISFDVKVMFGDDQVYPSPNSSGTSETIRLATNKFAPKWEEGFSYIYNIAIGPDDLKLNKISFSVTEIGEWKDANDTGLDIQN